MTARMVLALVVAVLAAACATPVRMAVSSPHTSCRVAPPDRPIVWIRPDDDEEQRALDEQCRAVGPPVLVDATATSRPRTRRLVVATWNMHDGRGDLLALVRALREGQRGQPAPDGVIVLLQEVVRSMTLLPASAIVSTEMTGDRVKDVPPLVRELGWHFAYLPARRNRLRPVGAASADRGVAILSSLPLSNPEAIELPVERQRRLALSTIVSGADAAGRPWELRVVTVHLENRSGARRFWSRAAASRTRQTEALLDGLALSPAAAARPLAPPLIVGGDFNTWLGEREHALHLLRDRFGSWPDEDARPTISGPEWRLDYLFAHLPGSVRTTHRRLDSRYGSDHHPVVAEIDFGAS